MSDKFYMTLAIKNALKGIGTTSPNPMVGAVIVKNGQVIGEGFHVRSGEPHAEPNAIANSIESVENSTMYVTLEPCCHVNKKTPPCTDLIIEKKIKRVVIAALDPNPEVAGKGVELLRSCGIEVEVGLLEKEAKDLIEVFSKAITSEFPFVHLKLAQSLDGKISTLSGDSKWITDEQARTEVHRLRLKYDAVMVGRKTLNNDNPKLNIRMGVDAKGKVPIRIIVGDPEKFNEDSFILSEDTEKTIVLCSFDHNVEKLVDKKIKYIQVKQNDGEINLSEAFIKLKELGIQSILVEGGSRLAGSIIKEKLFDRATIYIAPILVGEGRSYWVDAPIKMSDSLKFENVSVRALGNQAVFEVKNVYRSS